MGLKEILFGESKENSKPQTIETESKEMDNTVNNENKVDKNENSINSESVQDEITSDMLICNIISKHPSAAQFLMDCGMECIFCPASQMETLAEACAVHGIDGDEICAALNEKIAEHNE